MAGIAALAEKMLAESIILAKYPDDIGRQMLAGGIVRGCMAKLEELDRELMRLRAKYELRQKNTYEGDGTDAPVGTILSWMRNDREIVTVKMDGEWETVGISDAYDLRYLLEMLPSDGPIVIIRWPVGIQP